MYNPHTYINTHAQTHAHTDTHRHTSTHMCTHTPTPNPTPAPCRAFKSKMVEGWTTPKEQKRLAQMAQLEAQGGAVPSLVRPTIIEGKPGLPLIVMSEDRK